MITIDKEIILKAVNGEIDSFGEIYKSFSGFVYATALRMSQNTEFAKEITQEVFIKVLKNIKSFKFKSEFSTWLYRISVTTTINSLKKNSKIIRREMPYNDALKSIGSKAPDTEERVFGNYDNEAINDIIKKLPRDQRICIILRSIEGLSYSDIAKSLHTNLNTVKTRIRRARETILEEYKKGSDLK